MDVEMHRPGMVRRLRQHRFKALLDVCSPELRLLAARLPIVPGLGVHTGLGRDDRKFEVVRVLVGERDHRVGEGGIERLAIFGRILGIAPGYRLDQAFFLVGRTCGQRLRLAHRVDRQLVHCRVHRRVDVGSEHQRFGSKAHGAIRIEALSLSEGAARLGMIEVRRLPDALVEISLSLRVLGADRIGERAEIGPQRRFGALIGLDHLRHLARHRHGRGDPAMRPCGDDRPGGQRGLWRRGHQRHGRTCAETGEGKRHPPRVGQEIT